MAPPVTASPTPFITGRDSPVSMDSSTSDPPSSMTPSTGMRPPGRTTTRSPTRTAEVGTSTSTPSRSTRAVGGARSISLRMASEAPARARISSQCPMRMKTSSRAEAS